MHISLGSIKRQILKEGRLSNILDDYPKSAHSIIRKLSELDPSGNNKYLQWMVSQIFDAGEQSSDVLSAINTFENNIQRIQNKDINAYFDLAELQQALERLDAVSKTQARKNKKAEHDVVYSSGDVKVIYPRSHKAAKFYGAGTKWCTSGKDPKDFYEYNSEGDTLFYAMKGKEKYALVLYGDRPGPVIDYMEVYDEADVELIPKNVVTYLGGLRLLKALVMFSKGSRRVSFDDEYASAKSKQSRNWD